MSFCDFVPDDPSCATTPEPVEPTPVEPEPVDPVVPVEPVDPVDPVDPVEPVEPMPEAGGDGEVAEGDDKMASEAMWGNLAFLGVAVMHVAHPALEMFRYRSDADYYLLGDTAFSTNWWSLYNMIMQYGLLAAGSVLTITQLLSMFGIAVETNVMLWHMTMMWVAPILSGVVGMMAWWGYDQAHVNCEDSGYANQADACAVKETIEYEMLKHSVMELTWGATLMEASEGWMMAQFMALPMEAQKAWMEAHMAEEMMKKEHMEAKAKELGIDMGKDSMSEWSSEDDM